MSTQTFAFDAARQLLTLNSSNDPADEAFAYDRNGNRTRTGLVTGPHNRLTSDANFNYTYNHEGNLTRKAAKVGTASTDTTYDHRNRLTGITNYANVSTVTSSK
jgi:hypothetical protein